MERRVCNQARFSGPFNWRFDSGFEAKRGVRLDCPDLLQYDEVWAAAGTWNDVFGAAPADIVRVAGGVVTDLKRV